MPVFDAHKNLAVATVTTPPTPGTSGNSVAVATGQGARFPVPPFNATVWPATQPPASTNAEVLRVVAIAGDVFQIIRAQETTPAREIVAGDLIAETITAKTLTDIETAINGLGSWQDQAFNAAHFSGTAPMTWTVGAAAVIRNRYALVGKTLFWSVYISWFSGANALGGSPAASIVMQLPAGQVGTSQFQLIDFCAGLTGVPAGAGLVGSISGNTFTIQKSAGGNFLLSDVPGLVFNALIEIL